MKANKAKYLATAIVMAGAALAGQARDAQGLKVYINPGHGGHESNDRNVVIYPYVQGDPEGYWESNSNLSKGLQLRDMLEAKGYTVVMSRVTNTSDDDLGLSTIVRLSNESKADVFFSIHSNATGTVARRNFPLMLYRGYDNEPQKPNDLVVCKILNKYLLQNQATYWTSTSENCRGDWSFYKSWGTQGLGVLRGNNVTAMLSEGSFHDYIPEAYRLMSDDFCWLEAWHFRKAVDEYFGVEGVKVGAIAGRLNDNRVPRDGEYVKYGDDKFATIQGATVELLDKSGKVLQTYKTHAIHTNGFYLFKDLEPGEYKVRASVETHQPVETDVTVVADEVSFANMTMAKVRNTPPKVESYSPVWKEGDEALLCNTPVVFQFNWDMDMDATEKAFKIEPPVAGTFTWEDLNYRMVFTPTEPYAINTKYTVTLSTEAAHAGGAKMENPVSFSFLTTDRNFMSILGSFPKQDEAVHYQDAAIEFRFDKRPDTKNVLKQVTCTNSKGEPVQFFSRGMTTSKSGAAYGFFRIPFVRDLEIGETYNLTLSGDFSDRDGITIQKPVNLTFKAVNAGETKTGMTPVDAMDESTTFTYNAEGSDNVANASVAKSTDKLFGTAATTFNYTFNDTERGEVLYSRPADEAVTIKPDTKLGVHVHGDLTNNDLYLELTCETATQYVHVCSLDFLGWRYIQVPAVIEGDAHLTGVKLIQQPSMMSKTGTFKIDDIIMPIDAGVDNVEVEGLTIYPNPASEYLVANAGCIIAGIELVSLNGTVVARTAGNALNVQDVPAGTYLALVQTASGQTVFKVQIVH